MDLRLEKTEALGGQYKADLVLRPCWLGFAWSRMPTS